MTETNEAEFLGRFEVALKMANMRFRCCFILLLLILVKGLFAAPGKVLLEAKVDRTNIKIGDLINYSIVVSRDADMQIKMPDLGANLGAFEIRDYEDIEPTKQNGEIIQQRKYTISTYDIGDYEIPPVAVQYALLNDTLWHELSTEAIKITVESLKPSEEGDIRDIKQPLEILKDWWLTIRFVLAGVIIIVIGILVYVLYRRYKAGKALIPRREKPKLPPHVIALGALESLIKKGLLEKGEIKQFYIRLSEIIRQYIEDRFFIYALEMTTGQLIDNLQANQIEDGVVQQIDTFLSNCDLVKFAKYLPEEAEHKSTTDLAFKIVNDTKIIFAEEVETSESTADGATQLRDQPLQQASEVQALDAGKTVLLEGEAEKEGGVKDVQIS